MTLEEARLEIVKAMIAAHKRVDTDEVRRLVEIVMYGGPLSTGVGPTSPSTGDYGPPFKITCEGNS